MDNNITPIAGDYGYTPKFIKIAILAGVHPITGKIYWVDEQTFDRSTMFHGWIPPGIYKDLTLIAIGQAGQRKEPQFADGLFTSYNTSYGDYLIYAGPLILID